MTVIPLMRQFAHVSWPAAVARMLGIGVVGLALAQVGGLLSVHRAVALVLVVLACGVVFWAAWGVLALFLRRRADVLAMRMTRHDPDCAFLTDRAGRVIFANDAAVQRFGVAGHGALADLFAAMLANPHPFLQRLICAADRTGASKEDVITRRGRFRLGVVVLPHDRHLWRMHDLADSDAPGGDDSHGLPVITVAADDSVIGLNNAARALIGRKPAHLTDIFSDLPLAPGQHNALRTGATQKSLLVMARDRTAGQRDLFLFADQRGDGPRFFNAGWQAIEDLPIPLLKIGISGAVLGTNRYSRNLLDITPSDDLTLMDLLDGLGRPITDWLREAFEGRGGRSPQFLRGRNPHQDTFVQVTLNAAGGTSDPHLIAVLNDVTELKSLEEKFVQSQKMQAIGQLAGGVAHDFNNLLTAISGHCDLLLLRHDESDQSYGDLTQIHQNANRAASLVGQLLAFSRKQTLQPEVIDLRETLSDLTHLLNRLVGEKVTLVLDHDPTLLPIRADRRQLEQVLMNLVVNARDAMQGAGQIRVETQNLVLREPLVRDRAVVPVGDYVLIKVIDTGHGIAPDKLTKIFEPFYTTKRPGEGTGLGLSTAYGIVKQTGGYIFVDSALGQGTTFSLLFPSHDLPVARPVVVPRAARAPDHAPDHAPGGVVLLVEDEAPVRAFASRALRLRGYTVLEADCAEAALTLLSDDSLLVDIFVTDVVMPGMDGPSWVRQALRARPLTKVVFVSGYAEDAFSDGQSRVPGAVFLPKPFSLNALTQTVQDQLTQKLPA